MFESGQTYPITITLADPGQRRWGFEVTPLTQGTCTIINSTHTQRSIENGKTYIKHTQSGTFDNTLDGPINWTFDWTAPSASPDQIAFYVAGNAANSSDEPTGDYIYTTSFTTNRATATDDNSPRNLIPDQLAITNFPNPFNAATQVTFNLPQAGHVALNIYDITGRAAGTLLDEYRPAGTTSIIWDGSSFTSSVYFLRLTTDSGTTTRRSVLLK